MEEDKKLVIHLVETPQCCFITDCVKTSGYESTYHSSKISHLFFDGEKAERTFAPNWMRIKQFPKTIEQVRSGEVVNARYELKEPDLASEKLPISIPLESRENYSGNIIETLYSYKYDTLPPTMEAVDADIQMVLKLSDYIEPSLEYEAIGKFGWDERTYAITSANVKHQLFDKLLFPEICLAHRPCSLSSKQVYDITRQYVLTYIDKATAKITSNYDFCFTVKKIVPMVEPETVTFHNMFARTKKERAKIRTAIKSFTEHEIFQMTHAESNYQGYTAIPGVVAKSEAELKEKMDEWLSTLIKIINAPIQECPHCKGTGLLGEVERVSRQVLSDISARDVTK